MNRKEKIDKIIEMVKEMVESEFLPDEDINEMYKQAKLSFALFKVISEEEKKNNE